MPRKSSQFQNKLYHFNRHELKLVSLELDVKNDLLEFPESESDKKYDTDS